MTPFSIDTSFAVAVRYSVLKVYAFRKREADEGQEWPVSMTVRFHLFPFRTQKLSLLVPKIVSWKRLVKIGSRRLRETLQEFPEAFFSVEKMKYLQIEQDITENSYFVKILHRN